MFVNHNIIRINSRSIVTRVYYGCISFILFACGSNTRDKASKETLSLGFDASYDPPVSSSDPPKDIDPYFKVLEPVTTDPTGYLRLRWMILKIQ